MKKIISILLLISASLLRADSDTLSPERQKQIFDQLLKKYTCHNVENCKAAQGTLKPELFKQELADKNGLGGIIDRIKNGDKEASKNFEEFRKSYLNYTIGARVVSEYAEKENLASNRYLLVGGISILLSPMVNILAPIGLFSFYSGLLSKKVCETDYTIVHKAYRNMHAILFGEIEEISNIAQENIKKA